MSEAVDTSDLLLALRGCVHALRRVQINDLTPGGAERLASFCEGIIRGNQAPGAPRPATVFWPQSPTPIETAPRDGSAFLAMGVHDQDDPPGAQRGLVAGDIWWAIILWDIWREPRRWVFAKDGEAPWSAPLYWIPLPAHPDGARP